jgi:hypothetical protein
VEAEDHPGLGWFFKAQALCTDATLGLLTGWAEPRSVKKTNSYQLKNLKKNLAVRLRRQILDMK